MSPRTAIDIAELYSMCARLRDSSPSGISKTALKRLFTAAEQQISSSEGPARTTALCNSRRDRIIAVALESGFDREMVLAAAGELWGTDCKQRMELQQAGCFAALSPLPDDLLCTEVPDRPGGKKAN